MERDQKRKNEKMTAEDITQLINDITSDQKRAKEITVLPIMCGSGKSTAISYLIRQTIENASLTGNGLLVVTDSIDRLDDYMHPYDNTLHSFLDEHDDQVCIMTHENIEKAHKTQYDKPVLMMTTQRYFRLTVAEINRYLKWESGTRPLIIIDENPELMTFVELDFKKIEECITAVSASETKIHIMKPDKELRIVLKYYTDFVHQLKSKKCGEQNSLRCFWSWYTKYNIQEQEEYVQGFKEDYRRIHDNKNLINQYGGGTYYDDIFTRFRAIRELERSYALIRQRKYDKNMFDDSMLLFLDNYELVHDVKAKVIILDGTADLSSEYFPSHYSLIDPHDFNRPLNHLHIKIINYPTGKTALVSSKDKRDQLLDFVQLYFSEIVNKNKLSEKDWAIFTYKDLEKSFKNQFGRNNIEHFGNIKGKNDFRNARHIFQIGLNRYPDEVYYLLYRARYPDKAHAYKNMEEAYEYLPIPVDWPISWDESEEDTEYTGSCYKKKEELNQEEALSQSAEIEAEITDLKGETKTIMNRMLLAEIEQNFFRGTIRNSDSQDDFYFHIFLNPRNYEDLIKLMKERYEPLGAEITYAELPKTAPLLRIMTRKGDSYAKRLIHWHDDILQIGEEYTPESIRQSIGLDGTTAIQSYQLFLHKTPILRTLLGEERVQRGLYKKKNTWYKR